VIGNAHGQFRWARATYSSIAHAVEPRGTLRSPVTPPAGLEAARGSAFAAGSDPGRSATDTRCSVRLPASFVRTEPASIRDYRPCQQPIGSAAHPDPRTTPDRWRALPYRRRLAVRCDAMPLLRSTANPAANPRRANPMPMLNRGVAGGCGWPAFPSRNVEGLSAGVFLIASYDASRLDQT